MKLATLAGWAGCLALAVPACGGDAYEIHPRVHIEYQESVEAGGDLDYVFAEGTLSGTVRDGGRYTVPVQIHHPVEGGNGAAVLELTNSALTFFHLAARGDRVGDRRTDADDLDELEAMQVTFGFAGAKEYLLRNGFTYMAIQPMKSVTDFMGESPPEGRDRRNLAYGLSGSGYFLRSYLFRDANAGGEIDGVLVHAAGSMNLDMIDDAAECPDDPMCVGAPRFSHWNPKQGPPPTHGAKVLAIDAQSDLDFNAGALARAAPGDADPNYVRWEVAGAPHVPVFALDMRPMGAVHQNTMDWSSIWRSGFHHLNAWVRDGTPPPSPPLLEGESVAARYGPESWKGKLDGDGNAVGGIRLPEIEAPRGVYTGFDFSWIDPAVAKDHRYAMVFASDGAPAAPSDPVEACRLVEKAYRGVGLGFPRSSDRLRSTGTVNAAVLFADFPDVEANESPQKILDILSPTASDFFDAVSYGRMNLVLTPHLHWLRMGKPSAHYAEAMRDFEGHRDWLQEAIDLADDHVDFREADLVVVMATPEATKIGYGPTWTGLDREGGVLEADGARITNGITSGADLVGWGGLWLNHEMGHSLSLADLYAFGSPDGFTRPFSLMDLISGEAPEYLAYERWFLGWLDDDQIACLSESTEVRLEPIEAAGGLKAAIVPRSPTRAVVVESRRALGWDAELDREGAVVYVVDTTIASGKGPVRVANERRALQHGESVTVDGVEVRVVAADDEGDTVRVAFGPSAEPEPEPAR